MITGFQLYILLIFTIGGTVTTICFKFIDKQKSRDQDGFEYNFNHPFFQTAVSLLAMNLCFIPYFVISFVQKPRLTNGYDEIEVALDAVHAPGPLIFVFPGLMVVLSNCLAFIGLNLTYASSYQMLIGSTMVFTGILSAGFLNASISWLKWVAIMIIFSGLVSVGLCDYIYTKENSDLDLYGIITGDLLIIMSRILSSVEFVYEEKYIKKYNISALRLVSWEGFFGLLIASVLLVIFYFIKIPALNTSDPEHRLENMVAAFYQIKNNSNILWALVVYMLANSFFNYGAMSFTKEFSATTRVVTANMRTIIVWGFSVLIGWETFHTLQLLGCFLIIIGTCVYANVIAVLLQHSRNKNTTLDDQTSSNETLSLLNNRNQEN